jgi:hypothetical protein
MADLSDVSAALVGLIGATLYPNGASQPSVVNTGVKIFAGWPIPEQLDSDLAAGLANVSVYPRPENRNTTRYMNDWQSVSLNTASLTLSIAGQTVTVAGTVPGASNPHNLVVFVNGSPYVYPVQPTDTLSSIAAALAALIVASVAGTSSTGAVITVPAPAQINAARVGITGVSANEIRRQEQLYQIGVWSPTPGARDKIAIAIDLALAALPRFTLADDSVCRLIWKSSLQSDKFEKQNLYRRDLFYTAEFPTIQTETETQITQTKLNVQAAPAGTPPYQPVATVYD